MSVLRAALLLSCAAAACGRAMEPYPSRLAMTDTTRVDTVVPRVDTILTAVTTDSTHDVYEPEPEPRPGAIGCRRTDTPRPVPDSAIVQDLRGGARFACVLREGHPPIEARVDADESGYVL